MADMDDIIIRRELPQDYEAVESMTRQAFWNQHVPGCCEHYLAHVLRGHPDFIPQLDLVAEQAGEIVGNIMYTKAWLEDKQGSRKEILTFGPLSVAPHMQRRGIGKRLMAESFQIAAGLGYDAVVIFGHPGNYVSSGFQSCARYNITLGGSIPTAMLVKLLRPDALDGREWEYLESPAYAIEEAEAEAFDRRFPEKKKEFRPSQEEFYIYSHSTIQR